MGNGCSLISFLVPFAELRGGHAVELFEGAAEVAGVGEATFLHDLSDVQIAARQQTFGRCHTAGQQISHHRCSCDFFELMGQRGNADGIPSGQLLHGVLLRIMGLKASLNLINHTRIFLFEAGGVGNVSVDLDQQFVDKELLHMIGKLVPMPLLIHDLAE